MKKSFFAVLLILFISLCINAGIISFAQGINISQVSYQIFIDNKEIQLDSPIYIINDRTYVPLRELFELLDRKVEWRDGMICVIDKEENGLYPFEKDGLYGYKNKKDEVVIKPKYSYASSFHDGLAAIKGGKGSDGKYGFINEKEDKVIPCMYDQASNFSHGYALVAVSDISDNGGSMTEHTIFYFINKNGEKQFDKEFLLAYSFSEGRAAVLKEGYGAPLPPDGRTYNKWSYIGTDGNYVTEMTFDEALSFKNGYAYVKKDQKWGMIDWNFDFVIDCIYDNLEDVQEAAGQKNLLI